MDFGVFGASLRKITRSRYVTTLLAVGASILIGGSSDEPQMIASFTKMSDTSFELTAIAPNTLIREYSVCKAIWMAEKKKIEKISLSNPVFGAPKAPPPLNWNFPSDWSSLETTAYLNSASPDGNPAIDVSDKAASCRNLWPWYH